MAQVYGPNVLAISDAARAKFGHAANQLLDVGALLGNVGGEDLGSAVGDGKVNSKKGAHLACAPGTTTYLPAL